MWRLWPASAAPPREPVGTELTTLAMAVVVAVVAGNLAPPDRAWAWALLAGLAAALVVALAGGARLVWACAGACLGLAACALASRAPAADVKVPVRFVADIRDGWKEVTHGFATRVALRELTGAGGALRHPSEVELVVGGSVTPATLPPAGSRLIGAGELAARSEWALQPPVLRVKTPLLLDPGGHGRWTDRVREGAAGALDRAAGTSAPLRDAAGLAAALVLGRRDWLPAEEVASLRRSGLAHLLAVSGLHVGVVAVLAWGLLNLLRVPPAPRRLLVVVVLLSFALLAGGNAPVRRATAAAVAYLVARSLGRPLEPLPTVWAVVAGLLVFEPAAAFQAGFQLSAGVALALVRFAGPLQARLAAWVPALPRWFTASLAVAAVAQGASLPLTGQYFVSVSWLGMVANLVAVPLALPLVLASVLALLGALVSPSLGGVLLWLVAAGQWLLDGISDLGGVLTWPFPELPVAAAVLLAIVAAVALTRWRHAAWAGLAGVAALLVFMVWPGRAPRGAELRLLAARDGLAVLLRDGRHVVLLDTGASLQEAWRDLARLRVRGLDALVLSHADEDHIGGALTLLERYRIGELVLPAAIAARPEVAPLLAAAATQEIPVRLLAAGERSRIGGFPGVVLWPPATGATGDNDTSLVLRVTLAGRDVLLTGDIEAPTEERLLAVGARLDADVLQLAHHGSRTSSSEAFLRAVAPRVAVAATGLDPRFEHPHRTVRQRVLALPAVLVEQAAGVSTLWWDAGGPLWVGTAEPVAVPAKH